jgi:hypothetical protein
MPTITHKSYVLLGLVALGLILIIFSIQHFLSKQINPVALTRHAIAECERVENEVASEINSGNSPADLKTAFGSMVKRTKAFSEGYIRISDGNQPVVLDAWKRPLQIMTKSNLLTLPNVSSTLLSKTNQMLIWSIGANGSNEFGNGDDVFPR